MVVSSLIPPDWHQLLVDFYEKFPSRGLPSVEHFPIFPWIAPRVSAKIIEKVRELGVERKLTTGELLFEIGARVDKLCINQKGFSARSLVNPAGFEAQGIGIAPPFHIAAGNLNFFTQRPCSGCYYALCPSQILECSSQRLREAAQEDSALMFELARHFEMCAISDRMVFACRALINSEHRLQAFLCSWAANFGLLDQNRSKEVKIETVSLPGPALIGKIMAINPLVVERTLEKWESLELLDISNGKTLIVPSLIDPIYQWITLKDKESGVVPYPPSIQTYLEKEQPHFQGS